MKSHRRPISIAALLAAGALAYAPAGANAGSLLSGYGGPGQGSQALLGSTLIGGGGSSGGSGGGSGGPSGQVSLEASSSTTHRSAGGGGSARRSGARPAGRPAAAGGEGLGRTALAGFHETGAGSSTLGLTGIDLVYIIAVLAGLALVAVLTRGAARGARPGAPD